MNHCKKEGAYENKLSGSIIDNVDGIALGSSDNGNICPDNNNTDVDNIVEGMNKINITDMSKCAACGKGGDNLKVCTSCEQVSYCNAKCRKAHRSKHKKVCKKLAAERKLKDDKLFSEPPPKEDCPNCMQPIPYAIGMCGVYTTYMPCCGKTLCEGCHVGANEEINKGNLKDCCAFCRQPSPHTDEELLERVKKRMKLNDGGAFTWLGSQYQVGRGDFPQDYQTAIGLWKQAAKFGSIKAHNSLASTFYHGKGVEKDEKMGIHHYNIAAIGGHEYARLILGDIEIDKGSMDRAMKHYMISARSGYDKALEEVSEGYKAGCVTKDEYATTLRTYKDSQDEMKSEQRSKGHALRRLREPKTL